MDMFFAEVEATDAVQLRRRLHFNAAMLEARALHLILLQKGIGYQMTCG